jgi:hypothetical protein
MPETATASSLATGGKSVFMEVLDLAFEWILPIAFIGVGFYVAFNSLIGGPWTIANIVYVGSGKNTSAAINDWAGGGVFALLYGLAAYGLWKHGGSDGAKFVTRPAAGFLGGMALGSVGWAAAGKGAQGPLDTGLLSLESQL